MRLGVGCAVAVCLTLASCGEEGPKPRIATQAETEAILAPLIPHSAKERICIRPKLQPPLNWERQELATEKLIREQRPFPQQALDKLSEIFFGSIKQNPRDWYQARNGQTLRLQPKDAAHLDGLLREASNAKFPNGEQSWSLPLGVHACDERDENTSELDPSPVFRYSYSQPVIVGNIAFVETAGVCGGLCGSGGLVAMINRGNGWLRLAGHMTWMS